MFLRTQNLMSCCLSLKPEGRKTKRRFISNCREKTETSPWKLSSSHWKNFPSCWEMPMGSHDRPKKRLAPRPRKLFKNKRENKVSLRKKNEILPTCCVCSLVSKRFWHPWPLLNRTKKLQAFPRTGLFLGTTFNNWHKHWLSHCSFLHGIEHTVEIYNFNEKCKKRGLLAPKKDKSKAKEQHQGEEAAGASRRWQRIYYYCHRYPSRSGAQLWSQRPWFQSQLAPPREQKETAGQIERGFDPRPRQQPWNW